MTRCCVRKKGRSLNGNLNSQLYDDRENDDGRIEDEEEGRKKEGQEVEEILGTYMSWKLSNLGNYRTPGYSQEVAAIGGIALYIDKIFRENDRKNKAKKKAKKR